MYNEHKINALETVVEKAIKSLDNKDLTDRQIFLTNLIQCATIDLVNDCTAGGPSTDFVAELQEEYAQKQEAEMAEWIAYQNRREEQV